MAWGIEEQKDGRWKWWTVQTAYGATVGFADSRQEAEEQLLAAERELLAGE